MATEGYKVRKRQYSLKYQKDYYASLVLHFNRKYEGDIIEALDKLPNKSEYVKQLIRKDLGLE